MSNTVNPPAQSVLADLVQLAPKTRAAVESLSLPGDDETWIQLKRAFLRCIAWVQYWKASGDCPEAGLKGASLKTQLEATLLDADVLSSEKLILKFPEQRAALEPLQKQGTVFAKGWVVMLWEVSV